MVMQKQTAGSKQINLVHMSDWLKKIIFTSEHTKPTKSTNTQPNIFIKGGNSWLCLLLSILESFQTLI